MKMTDEIRIAAPRDKVFEKLNDPDILKGPAIAGFCFELLHLRDRHFRERVVIEGQCLTTVSHFPDGTEEEETEDPRAVLVARLLEYERYKEAAQQLHQQEEIRNATWVRPEGVEELLATNGHEGAVQENLLEVDLFELISAFREVLERVRQRADLVVERETISIEEMIRRLEARLAENPQTTFVALFDDAADRATVIVIFLAILEMVRLRKMKIYQQHLFGTIHVTRVVDDG